MAGKVSLRERCVVLKLSKDVFPTTPFKTTSQEKVTTFSGLSSLAFKGILGIPASLYSVILAL